MCCCLRGARHAQACMKTNRSTSNLSPIKYRALLALLDLYTFANRNVATTDPTVASMQSLRREWLEMSILAGWRFQLSPQWLNISACRQTHMAYILAAQPEGLLLTKLDSGKLS
jgi:hypothetical protein